MGNKKNAELNTGLLKAQSAQEVQIFCARTGRNILRRKRIKSGRRLNVIRLI